VLAGKEPAPASQAAIVLLPVPGAPVRMKNRWWDWSSQFRSGGKSHDRPMNW